MLGTALYYPYIDISDGGWLKSALLFWDEVQTIVPSSITTPYQGNDTIICEQEGYLRPLRCDFHQDLLEELGDRVLKLLKSPEWASTAPSQDGLMRNDLKWRVEEMVGIHLDKMSALLRAHFIESGGELIAAEKLPSHLRGMPLHRSYHAEDDWIIVTGRFAQIYMSALAALLARKLQVSPLTNEEASSGVNLRCLIEDVASSGPSAAKGALVSVVMEGLRVDPEAPIQRLLAFRRSRADQLAELSGLFDDLKGGIERSASLEELEDAAKALFENRIRPGLQRLKHELKLQTIQSAWEGILRAITYSVPAGGMLAMTGFSGSMLLGAGAFITMADVGIKSHLARARVRVSSPYTYLLDVEHEFPLPKRRQRRTFGRRWATTF